VLLLLVSLPAAVELGWDGTLEELQALVASLDMAVAFSRSITACMPTITQVGSGAGSLLECNCPCNCLCWQMSRLPVLNPLWSGCWPVAVLCWV
jgi:hypothetical protein